MEIKSHRGQFLGSVIRKSFGEVSYLVRAGRGLDSSKTFQNFFKAWSFAPVDMQMSHLLLMLTHPFPPWDVPHVPADQYGGFRWVLRRRVPPSPPTSGPISPISPYIPDLLRRPAEEHDHSWMDAALMA